MIDYLEEALENAAGLLERVRQLEQGPPDAAGKGAKTGEDGLGSRQEEGTAFWGRILKKRNVNQIENMEHYENRDHPPEGNITSTEIKKEVTTVLEQREGALLLQRIEEMEKMAPLLHGYVLPGGERRPAPETGDRTPAEPGRFSTVHLPGEEMDWAERADRAFCRDSRRYDGSFYLY